jgi:hypothetical protein
MAGTALCLAIIYCYITSIPYYLSIIRIICLLLSIIMCPHVRRDSPRVLAWCWRRIPGDKSACGGNNNDAHCSGSAHGVPTLVRCRRCMSMAVREPNSPEQWMHLKPTACGAFTFAGALSPARDAGIQIPEAFTMQFKFKLRCRVLNPLQLPLGSYP